MLEASVVPSCAYRTFSIRFTLSLPVDLLDAAAAEAARAKRATLPEADLVRRQAAEKLWGYVATELNRLFREAGFPVEPGPGAHEHRRQWLRELDRSLGRDFASRHEAFADLHGSCFYEARCPAPDVLEAMVAEARAFVDEVRAALREVRRRGARAA